jgi:hypothetical protein
MAKSKIGQDIRSQFTAANRIVNELSKFGAAQRERIMAIVAEHKFETPAADDKTGDLFDNIAPASAGN